MSCGFQINQRETLMQSFAQVGSVAAPVIQEHEDRLSFIVMR